MNNAINCLKREHDAIVAKIKAGEHDKVKDKIEIETAISWLQKILELDLKHSKAYDFIKLPDIQDIRFFEYHVMNDCDSGNINDWIELKAENGYPVTMVYDDVILRSK